MGRKIGLALGALVVVMAIAATVVLGRLDRMIVDGVESAGPQITGTDVSLGSASVSIFDGEGALRRLRIGNPEGFSGDDAFDLGEIAVVIDVKSVTQDVIRIRSVVIDAPRLLAEFDAGGRNNLDRILQNVRSAGSRTSKSSAKESSSAQRRLIIEEFRFLNAEVHALAPAFDLDKTLKLPPVVLKNLGAKQGGAAAADLANQVLRPIIAAAVQAAMKEYLAAQRAKLGSKAEEKLMDKLFDR
jgi:hypothetical protein